MQALVIDRMVEMTFAPLDEVVAWFNRLGLEARPQDDGVVLLINPHLNFRTAIYEGLDPVTKAVSLASAIAGQFWTSVFPGLLEAVNKEWKVRAKQASSPRQDNKQAGDCRPAATPPPTQPTFEEQYKRP